MVPNITRDRLIQRQKTAEKQWSRFVSGLNTEQQCIAPEIVSSWKRCASHLNPKVSRLNIDDEHTCQHRWQKSPLRPASRQERNALVQLASEGSLVAAIADAQGHLLWTFASQHMRQRAESVNFVPGSHLDELNAGTNAISLSLNTRAPTTVYSSEHYLSSMHEWVCYAAPIVHPQSGELMGVLDMSTTWDNHTPLGQAAVSQLAQHIEQRLPAKQPRAELEIYALGNPTVVFRGTTQRVSQRQLEILCLLALNPQGLSLNAFHAALYGDAQISTSTLKAELSFLRSMFDGQIGSRPYRLTVPVWGDFIHLWQILHLNDINAALTLYRGSFIPLSVSPEIEEWRHCIDALMGQLMNSCDDVTMIMEKMCHGSMGHSLVRERLVELIPRQAEI